MADLSRAERDARGRKLRVLHVITGLDAGGAEGMLSALLTARDAPDLEQAAVSLTPGGCHAERLRAAGIAVTELAMRRARPSPGELLRLARRIRAWRPDVVQGWMYHADLAALAGLALSGRRPATRLVWGLRCSDLDLGRYGPGLRLTVRACAALSGRPDAIVANKYNALLSGVTQQMQCALRAWKDNDVSVVETESQVPGEGLFILSAKVTDLGTDVPPERFIEAAKESGAQVVGLSALFAYAVVQTYQPEDRYGRVFAAYAGVFLIGATLWGWFVDGRRPDAFDVIGAGIVLVGIFVILAGRRVFA